MTVRIDRSDVPLNLSYHFISPSDVKLINFLSCHTRALGQIHKLIISKLSYDAAEMFPITLASCCSEEKPSPNTVLALLSAHWPNFCDVLVNVMLGVMVLLMMACGGRHVKPNVSLVFLINHKSFAIERLQNDSFFIRLLVKGVSKINLRSDN